MCVLFCDLSLLPQGVSQGDMPSGALSAIPLDFSGKRVPAVLDGWAEENYPG